MPTAEIIEPNKKAAPKKAAAKKAAPEKEKEVKAENPIPTEAVEEKKEEKAAPEAHNGDARINAQNSHSKPPPNNFSHYNRTPGK